MKLTFLIPVLVLFLSCSGKKASTNEKIDVVNSLDTEISSFQSILDSINLEGVVLIYDLKEDHYYTNNFERARVGKLPASTFKIPNSAIALETGAVENDSTLFKWYGEARNMSIWEKDMTFRDAFHLSCVPCYQDVARSIGTDRMKEYIDKLDYGDIRFDSTTIDNFWLVGDSKISPWEQVNFLKRLYQSKLHISKRTEQIMKRMMVMEENEEYKLSGKTGWSIDNEVNNGWFVGFIETDEKIYFFATNVEPTDKFDMRHFSSLRKEVTYAALEQMGIIK